MKLTKTQLAGELSRPELYLLHYGRLFAITALATSMDEANAHMLANDGEGLLAEHEGFCFVANKGDMGAASLTALSRALVIALAEASPGELADASRALDLAGAGHAGKARARRIARMLGPVVQKLRT